MAIQSFGESRPRPNGRGGVVRRDRPRERLARLGGRALADSELLALILRTGDRTRNAEALGREILDTFGGLRGVAVASRSAVEGLPGLGPAKAASLIAAVELSTRLREEPLERGRPIRSPEDVQRHFCPRLTLLARESFHVLLLDGRHRLIDEDEVSVGTLTASLVHPREVFRSAIESSAAALVLVHNHPSGEPSPSREDFVVTDRLKEAGVSMGIAVIDHVIVAESGYFSFREAGHLEI